MFNLTDLPGKPGITKAHNITSVSGAMKLVSKGEAVSTAGDNGAVTIWTDNEGMLRAESHRYLITQSSLYQEAEGHQGMAHDLAGENPLVASF